VVGVSAGGCVAALSTDRSIMRGLIVGTLAVWTGAAAQVTYMAGMRPVAGLMQFHESLTLWRFSLHALCAVLAILFGATSFQRGAKTRMLGT
jgi:hypothetical protein